MKKAESEFQKVLRLISCLKIEIEAVQLLHKAMYKNMCAIIDRPESAVLTNMYMPNEILFAMGLAPLSSEYILGTMATLKKTPELMDVVDQRVQSTGFCSYITGIIGIFENNHLPIPGFLILPSEICEDTPKIFEYLHYRYKDRTEMFFIDIPFTSDEHSVDYVAHQFEQLAGFLETRTGRKLDRQKLSLALALSNEAKCLGDKIKTLRKNAPPLIPGKYGINMASVISLFGSRDAVDILENLYREIKRRQKVGDFKGNRRRLYWAHLFPQYTSTLIRYLEKELNADIVGEEIFYIPEVLLNPDDPFRSLARKILTHPVHGSIEVRKTHIVKEALSHKADGVINFSPTFCRVARGVIPLLKEAFISHGVPFLELIGDPVDPRNYSLSQMETRLEAFMEVVGNVR